MAKFKKIDLKIKANIDEKDKPARVEYADKEHVKLRVDCRAKFTKLSGEASIIFDDGSSKECDIHWQWEGKQRGVGKSPTSLPILSNESTQEITVLATVWYDKVSKKASFDVKQHCSLKEDKPEADSDVDLLARVVHAEAAFLSEEEKAAVAWTVVNRRKLIQLAMGEGRRFLIRSFGQPSIFAIISHVARNSDGAGQVQYQSYWDKSRNWKALDRIDDPKEPLSCKECSGLNESIKVAISVLKGRMTDPFLGQGGAYFMHLSPNGVASANHKWIKKLPSKKEFTHYFWTFDYKALCNLEKWDM